MKPVKPLLNAVALFVSGFFLGFAPVRADELPADTNMIESLTPQQARNRARAFPGVEVEVYRIRWPGCLPLNRLTSLDAKWWTTWAGATRAATTNGRFARRISIDWPARECGSPTSTRAVRCVLPRGVS